MHGNLAEVIRELMDAQRLSVRKVSARIAEKHGGSVHGYTQQISRILNDANYDPTLSTVQKILSALNVSFWQVNRVPHAVDDAKQFPNGGDRSDATHFDATHFGDPEGTGIAARLDQLSADMADLKLGLNELREAIKNLL